jgi:hypothetical protein
MTAIGVQFDSMICNTSIIVNQSVVLCPCDKMDFCLETWFALKVLSIPLENCVRILHLAFLSLVSAQLVFLPPSSAFAQTASGHAGRFRQSRSSLVLTFPVLNPRPFSIVRHFHQYRFRPRLKGCVRSVSMTIALFRQ